MKTSDCEWLVDHPLDEPCRNEIEQGHNRYLPMNSVDLIFMFANWHQLFHHKGKDSLHQNNCQGEADVQDEVNDKIFEVRLTFSIFWKVYYSQLDTKTLYFYCIRTVKDVIVGQVSILIFIEWSLSSWKDGKCDDCEKHEKNE